MENIKCQKGDVPFHEKYYTSSFEFNDNNWSQKSWYMDNEKLGK